MRDSPAFLRLIHGLVEPDTTPDPEEVERDFREVFADDNAIAALLWHVARRLPEERLAEVLADLAEALSTALRQAVELDPTHLVHLLLNLADQPIRDGSAECLAFLRSAMRCDIRLTRHILAWRGYTWLDRARAIQEAARGERLDPHLVDWTSEAALELARTALQGLDLEELSIQAARLPGGALNVLADVSDIDEDTARRFGAQPGIADALPNIDDLPHGWSYNKRVVTALPYVPAEALDRHALRAGWALGLALFEQDKPTHPEKVAELLRRDEPSVEASTVCGVALLWADLRRLADYHRKTLRAESDRRRGVLARLTQHAGRWPQAWAASARTIVVRADEFGPDAADLLVLNAVRHDDVRLALTHVASTDQSGAVRDRAQGLLARASGAPLPAEELHRWLADSAARAFDGTPVFPHPLTSLSSTWLGSLELEQELAAALRRAATHIGETIRIQGAALEEQLTGMLLKEIEVAFRGAVLRIQSTGATAQPRTITVNHRPITKHEEGTWQCDIALLLDVNIKPDIQLELAGLVQVKKSTRLTKGARHDAWDIDVPQLVELLQLSESAGYWLLCGDGEVLCVTASWLHGLVRGHNALGQESCAVGYNDIRHHAVSLDQFMPELFLGTWRGTVTERTVAFARGRERLRPQHVFEIVIVADAEQATQNRGRR